MLLLQVIDKAGNNLLDYGALGIMVVGLSFGVWVLVRYIKNTNKAERDRLEKSVDERTEKCDILYTEIKDMQENHSEKITDLLIETNEIHKQTVLALNSTTAALNNNSEIFKKLIDKL